MLQFAFSARGSHNRAASPGGLPRPPGPGLPEALLWVGGYALAQGIVAAALVALLLFAAFPGWPPPLSRIWGLLLQASSLELRQLTLLVTGGVTLGALFLVVPAVFLRLRPDARGTLGMARPSSRHLVLLTGAVLPLMMLSNELYRAATSVVRLLQERLIDLLPGLQTLMPEDTVAMIQNQASETPYAVLLMIAGVGPAIGEELVFRGVIGRGLIGRWGLLPGVLMTSLLFAVAHGTPAHAVATLPIAVFLHVAYLATGSIWAPIFVHFANNALAVSLMKFQLGQNVLVSWPVLTSAALYVLAMGVLLWQSRRTTGVDDVPSVDGGLWLPSSSQAAWGAALAGSGVLSFTGAFCWSALAAL